MGPERVLNPGPLAHESRATDWATRSGGFRSGQMKHCQDILQNQTLKTLNNHQTRLEHF